MPQWRTPSWFVDNHLVLNIDKTAVLNITCSRRDSVETTSATFLVVTLDSRLTWLPHIEELTTRLSAAAFAVRRVSQGIGAEATILTYHSLFHSRMSYGLMVWGASAHTDKILVLQKRAVRATTNESSTTSCRPLFRRWGILTVYAQYVLEHLLEVRDRLPGLQRRDSIHQYKTRRGGDLHVPFRRLQSSSPTTVGVKLFNELPEPWKTYPRALFRRTVRAFLSEVTPYSMEEFVAALCSI